MFVCLKPKFEKPKSPETIEKLEKSYLEIKDMEFRRVNCPHCGIHVIDFFEDVVGHLAFKCPKCKGTILINSAYFHRSRTAGMRKTSYIKDRWRVRFHP